MRIAKVVRKAPLIEVATENSLSKCIESIRKFFSDSSLRWFMRWSVIIGFVCDFFAIAGKFTDSFLVRYLGRSSFILAPNGKVLGSFMFGLALDCVWASWAITADGDMRKGAAVVGAFLIVTLPLVFLLW